MSITLINKMYPYLILQLLTAVPFCKSLCLILNSILMGSPRLIVIAWFEIKKENNTTTTMFIIIVVIYGNPKKFSNIYYIFYCDFQWCLRLQILYFEFDIIFTLITYYRQETFLSKPQCLRFLTRIFCCK